jgi:hypothetical protein
VRVAISSRNKTLQAFAQVEDSAILFVRSYFAKLGLSTWAVDYTQTPYSPYNTVMRMAAIETFRFMITASAYDFLHPDTSCVNDVALLTRLYDHFVHRYMFDKWKVEIRRPGGNQLAGVRNKLSQARTRISFQFSFSPSFTDRFLLEFQSARHVPQGQQRPR